MRIAFRLVSSSMWVYSRLTNSDSWPMMSRTTDSGTPARLSQDVVLCRRLWNDSALTVRRTE